MCVFKVFFHDNNIAMFVLQLSFLGGIGRTQHRGERWSQRLDTNRLQHATKHLQVVLFPPTHIAICNLDKQEKLHLILMFLASSEGTKWNLLLMKF